MSCLVLGKLALVTGAGSGIGRATCKVLAREGACIIAADRNLNAARETVTLLSNDSNGNHSSLLMDVAQSDSVKEVLKTILETYKNPPSIVVNCAGITRDNFLLKLSEEDFQQVMDVNLKGTFLVVQTFAKAMVENELRNTSIITVASIMGKRANIGQANYGASKAAVVLLTKIAAKEFGQFGIRCNVVLPGFIKTPMTDAIPEKVTAKLLPLIPCKRMGQPEEVAEVIAFLASERSSYVNGAAIEIYGGL